MVHRVLAILALGTAFLVMASVFSPQRMLAQPRRATSPSQSTAASTDPHDGLRSLGSVESLSHVVRIYAAAQGPRYSVFTHAGEELGVLMTAEQVARYFPELQLPEVDFSAPPVDGAAGPVMLMDIDPFIPQW